MHSQLKGRFSESSINLTVPFTVTQFSTREGLPQNQVTEIIARNDKSLIVNTLNGITIFNGYFFAPLIKDSTFLKQVFSKIEYFSKSNSVYGCDQNHDFFMLYPTYKKIKIADTKINNIVASGDSLLLLGSNRAIYSYHSETGICRLVVPLSVTNSLPPNIFGKLHRQNNWLYISSHHYGLFAINLTNKTIKCLSRKRADEIKLNPNNQRLYCYTDNQLYELIKDNLIKVKVFDNTQNLNVNCMAFRGNNEIFIGSDEGLFIVYTDFYERYRKSAGLFSESIQSFYYDSIQDCLYAGSTEKGFQKLQFKYNYSYSIAENLVPGSLQSVIKTRSGHVLLCMQNGQIGKLSATYIERYISKKNTLFASLAEIKDTLFAGTWGHGLYIFKDTVLVDSLKSNNLEGLQVHASFYDSKGNYWIGTQNGISSGRSIKTIKPFLKNIINQGILNFYELRNGTICVAAVGCFYLIKNDSIIAKFDSKSGLKGKEVRAFYEDEEGKIWVGTYGGGLFCYHKNKLTSINSKIGCSLDADVFCFAKEESGYFYITSNHGLWRLSEKALNDFYYNKINYLVPFFYEEETGILNSEFNGGFQNSFVKTANNHFYFPSIEGLVMAFPDDLKLNKLTPTIDNVYINDTLSAFNVTKFYNNPKSIQIDFSCTNLAIRRNVYFQHKLIGETNYDWTPPKKSRTVYLRSLPHGKYIFLVRAIDGFNDKHPVITTFEFEIVPLFYQTFWFKLLVSLILILVLVWLVRTRVMGVRKRSQEMELYSRKVAEIELKAIQAQLNPHFIFNCLNSIKYCIMAKDFENANNGLSTFASLIRNTLENYDKFFVPFNKELKFITDYIELEKLRLKEQLNYEIIGQSNIPQESLIPHLIIQPHIENAIKHGISHLENQTGFLKIEFEKDNHEIICTITDNGIGRKASRLLNAKSGKHISKGTQLTYEKSAFLKQYINYTCTIQIIDLTYSNNEPIGTRVIIKMPNSDDNRNYR